MIYKRATKKIAEAGIENIVIKKCLWGASVENTTFKNQHSQCFDTPEEAAQAVIDGFRPKNGD